MMSSNNKCESEYEIGWIDKNLNKKINLGLWKIINNTKVSGSSKEEKTFETQQDFIPLHQDKDDIETISDNSSKESSNSDVISIDSLSSDDVELLELNLVSSSSDNEEENNLNKDFKFNDYKNLNDLQNDNKKNKKNLKIPWFNEEKIYLPGILGLHEEIEDFYMYIQLTSKEYYVRKCVYNEIKMTIKNKWPNVDCDLFGSTKVNLSLPTSDLDIVLHTNFPKISLFNLEYELIKSKITKSEYCKVISLATVPIIKFVHLKTGLKVDINLDELDGLRIIKFLKDSLLKYPNALKIILILKQFLYQRNLNIPYQGGLSSYGLTLMVISFFQMHPRLESNKSTANLGVLLLEFFELYGIIFNYKTLGIRVSNNGKYIKKSQLKFNDFSEVSRMIYVEDPLNLNRNTCRNTFRFIEIKKSFSNTFLILNKICSIKDYRELYNFKYDSILAKIISISEEDIDFRKRIENFNVKSLLSKQDLNSLTTSKYLNLNENRTSNLRKNSFNSKQHSSNRNRDFLMGFTASSSSDEETC